MQKASGQSIDTAALNEATVYLSKANVELDAIEENYKSIRAQQDSYNNSLAAGSNSAGSLMRNIMGAVGAYVGLKEIVGLSDTMASGRQRLSLIVDDENSVESLENKIYASAQSARASYTSVMDTVAKLGLTAKKAFSGNDEMIKFSELVAKNFVIGGASATEQASAMYQLTQAMASGRLQGDEYRSIIENAPLLAKSIEDYMVNVKGATGSMKDWASEGLLTADVIKAAVFNSSSEIEERFKKMPMTWSQVWTMTVNKLIRLFDPLLRVISWTAQHWSVLEPIVAGLAIAVGGLAAATAVYNGVLKINKIYKAISAAYTAMHTVATGAETTATFAATAAQYGFNAALLACPLTWILLIIIAVIAAFYAVIAVINETADTSISATGVILGVITTAIAFIWNTFLALVDFILGCINYIVNPWIAFANFFANLFNDPIGSIIHLFGDLADRVLGFIETIAKGIDKVFGTNLAGAVSGWREGLSNKVDDWAEKYGNGTYEKKINSLNLSSESLGLSRWSYEDAYSKGYGAGQSVDNKIGGAFDSLSYDISNMSEDTASINDTLTRSEEELEYLRDIAEREVVNRFTTAEVKVDFSGMTNRIEGDADINGFIEALTEDFSEALATAAEGVY